MKALRNGFISVAPLQVEWDKSRYARAYLNRVSANQSFARF